MKIQKQHIMKQPELGKKILELRKLKGFTQEELVEKCNLNVRTIQRIEAGDVSPRSYTVKAILNVLGFDYAAVFEEKYVSGKFDRVLGIKKEKIENQLNIAMIFGIVYFLVGFFEIGIEFISFEKETLQFQVLYIIIKAISFISLFIFFRGFVIVGVFFNNYLLQISSFLIIILMLFFAILDSMSLFFFQDYIAIYGISKLIPYGFLSILVGISFMRLNDFGDLAKWTGILKIVTGICFLAVILSPLGLVTQAIVEIFEIILIYKIATKIRNLD